MNIHPVVTRSDLKTFVNFPYDKYKDDPVWVPPLRSEQHNQFKPKTNPFLNHCERQLFLLKEGKTVTGRIAAFIDTLAADFWKEKIGLFGYFECCNTHEAADMLLNAAKDWLQTKHCTSMRGPWSFVSQEWGLVVEGFEPSPVIMAPYNPPYYSNLLEGFGLKKAKDLLCWSISVDDGYQIPPRILEVTESVAKRYGVRVRPIDMKQYDREIDTLIEVSNASIIDNWGFSPVTEDEVRAMAKDMKPVLQPRGVLFAEDKNGKSIAFAIALPDVNHLLKGLNGRLLPFGIFKLLWGVPRLKRYRMFGLGVIPEYQGKAVDSLIYRALYESLYAEGVWMEINYVLEDNWPMINGIVKLGAKLLRRYRVYEMKI